MSLKIFQRRVWDELMAAIDVRNNLVCLMRILASKDEQIAYQRNIPIADVPAELVCMWFDDLYHPDGELFPEAFSPVERDRLARFHTFYGARTKHLPDTLAEMHRDPQWLEVMSEAHRVPASPDPDEGESKAFKGAHLANRR